MSFDHVKIVRAITGLSAMQKLILFDLAGRADDNGYCWPSIPTIMKDTSIGKRQTVWSNLAILEAKSLVRVKKIDGRHNEYFLTLENAFKPGAETDRVSNSTGCKKGPGVGAETDLDQVLKGTPKIPLSNQEGTIISCPGSVEPDEKPKKKPKPLFAEDSEPYRLAKYMKDQLKAVLPTLKEPNLQTWAHDFDVALRNDERMADARFVAQVIKWAARDSFWRTNCQCPATLRNQFDKLTAKMARQGLVGNDNLPCNEVMELFHKHLPSNPKIKLFDRNLLAERWNNEIVVRLKASGRSTDPQERLSYLESCFIQASKSDILTGRKLMPDGTPYFVTLNALLEKEKFMKLVNGEYDNREPLV